MRFAAGQLVDLNHTKLFLSKFRNKECNIKKSTISIVEREGRQVHWPHKVTIVLILIDTTWLVPLNAVFCHLSLRIDLAKENIRRGHQRKLVWVLHFLLRFLGFLDEEIASLFVFTHNKLSCGRFYQKFSPCFGYRHVLLKNHLNQRLSLLTRINGTYRGILA